MNSTQPQNTTEPLVTAKELEKRDIMKKSTAYRMAVASKLPHYIIGPHGGGVRFLVSEVMAALRRPTQLR